MKKRVIGILFVLGFLVLPMVLAQYSGSWGYYNSPLQYLDNEWVMFSIIVLVFFAIIFYTINKAFDNPVVSGVIAGSLALLIAITVLRRGLLYGYAGDDLGSWIMIAVLFVVLGFLIKFSYEAFGAVGSAGTVIVVWLILRGADPYQFLPYGISDMIFTAYEFITSFFGLILLVLIAVFAAPFLEGESKGEKVVKKIFKNFGFKK